MNITNHKIKCNSGQSNDWIDAGLTEDQVKDINEIGYTGKLNGKPMNMYVYLDSISTDIVKYSLTYLNGNNMDFTDNYMLTKVIQKNTQSEIALIIGGKIKS